MRRPIYRLMTTSAAGDLRAVALHRQGGPGAVAVVLGELRRVAAEIRSTEIVERKTEGLRAMGEPGFWERESRFATLGEVEYLDRLQAALSTAERLARRLEGQRRDTNGGAADLAALLAVRLHVLDRALAGIRTGSPSQVFVRVRGSSGEGDEQGRLAAALAEMYRGWAARRGMRAESIELGGGSSEHVLAVSGLGSGDILRDETGLHLFEYPHEGRDEGPPVRVGLRVDVVPWPERPPDDDVPVDRAALRAFAEAPASSQVVRRYRLAPSPLVRDDVRGYRTGRLDRVLAGDFDLF